MKKFLLILFFGFLVWVIPYGISFLMVSLEESNNSLYIISNQLIIIASAVFFFIIYFRKIFSGFAGEGLIVGLIWFGISIGLDYLLLESDLSFKNYLLSDGIVYIAIPVIGIGYDLVTKRKIW